MFQFIGLMKKRRKNTRERKRERNSAALSNYDAHVFDSYIYIFLYTIYIYRVRNYNYDTQRERDGIIFATAFA